MQASSLQHAGRIPLAFWEFLLRHSPAPITCPCRPTTSFLWHSPTQMLPLSTYPNTPALLTKPRPRKQSHNPALGNNSRAVTQLNSLLCRAQRASQSTVTLPPSATKPAFWHCYPSVLGTELTSPFPFKCKLLRISPQRQSRRHYPVELSLVHWETIRP